MRDFRNYRSTIAATFASASLWGCSANLYFRNFRKEKSWSQFWNTVNTLLEIQNRLAKAAKVAKVIGPQQKSDAKLLRRLRKFEAPVRPLENFRPFKKRKKLSLLFLFKGKSRTCSTFSGRDRSSEEMER